MHSRGNQRIAFPLTHKGHYLHTIYAVAGKSKNFSISILRSKLQRLNKIYVCCTKNGSDLPTKIENLADIPTESLVGDGTPPHPHRNWPVYRFALPPGHLPYSCACFRA